jgi:hypothetical protein
VIRSFVFRRGRVCSEFFGFTKKNLGRACLQESRFAIIVVVTAAIDRTNGVSIIITRTTMILMNNVDNDVVPLLEEPIVAVVRMADDYDEKHQAHSLRTHTIEASMPAPHVMALASSLSSTSTSFDTEEAIRRLTQFIISTATTAGGMQKTDDVINSNRPDADDDLSMISRRTEAQHHDDDPLIVVDEAEHVAGPEEDTHDDRTCSSTGVAFAEQLPELFLPLYNAITMLQSHASLAHQEAAMAVQDADAARRQAQLWKHRAVRMSRERTGWQEDHKQLQARNQQLSQQRTLLKRAYKQLWQEQVSQSERSVETALLLHEDHLRGININNSCTEGTSDTEVSFDYEEEEESDFKEVKCGTDEDKSILARPVAATTTASPLSSAPHSPNSSSMGGSVGHNSHNNHDNNYYKPLLLQVTSGSLQKQLLQKHRLPRAKIAADDLALAAASLLSSPTSSGVVVRETGGGGNHNDAVPSSIVYQS